MPTMTIQTQVTITAMTCPVCGVHYGIDEAFRSRAHGNGNAWHCTNGHRLSYNETEADRKLKQAEENLKFYQEYSRRTEQELSSERKQHSSTKGQLTKTRKLVQGGVCPVDGCHRHFTNLQRHMTSKHPDELLQGQAR